MTVRETIRLPLRRWAWTAGVPAAAAAYSASRIGVTGTIAAAVVAAAVSVAVQRRWRARPARPAGTATRRQIAVTSSRAAMRRRAAVLRPSLAGLSWWRRRRTPVGTYATALCRAGGPLTGRTVHTSCEESTLRIGIPGTGKTAELIARVVDAPGGVVVTSTAADLYEHTASLRHQRGPVAVFNPGGIGGISSTLRWPLLAGCTDPVVAARRADDLIGPASGSPEAARWEAQARRVLAVLLHAAALAGLRVRDVAGWVANPDHARQPVIDALMDSPRAVEMCQAAAQALGMNARTRDGVLMPIAQALAWVTQPAAAEAGDPDPGTAPFTVEDLTDRAGALYLLGDDSGTVGPLVAALVAEIAHQARQTASVRPAGRLDPALTLVLDEVALVCPTPLDRWMAELRKRSIVIHAACQGLGQLRQRWGDNGASMILNSAAAVLVYGGCKDAADLALFAALAGDRDDITVTHDAHGRVASRQVRRVPVIDAATLAGLPNHRALLVRRGMPPVLVSTPIGWRRRDVRRAGPPPALAAAPVAAPRQTSTQQPSPA